MTESRKEKLLNMAEPMAKHFRHNKNKELTESQLGAKFKLAGNEVRYVIKTKYIQLAKIKKMVKGVA